MQRGKVEEIDSNETKSIKKIFEGMRRRAAATLLRGMRKAADSGRAFALPAVPGGHAIDILLAEDSQSDGR